MSKGILIQDAIAGFENLIEGEKSEIKDLQKEIRMHKERIKTAQGKIEELKAMFVKAFNSREKHPDTLTNPNP